MPQENDRAITIELAVLSTSASLGILYATGWIHQRELSNSLGFPFDILSQGVQENIATGALVIIDTITSSTQILTPQFGHRYNLTNLIVQIVFFLGLFGLLYIRHLQPLTPRSRRYSLTLNVSKISLLLTSTGCALYLAATHFKANQPLTLYINEDPYDYKMKTRLLFLGYLILIGVIITKLPHILRHFDIGAIGKGVAYALGMFLVAEGYFSMVMRHAYADAALSLSYSVSRMDQVGPASTLGNVRAFRRLFEIDYTYAASGTSRMIWPIECGSQMCIVLELRSGEKGDTNLNKYSDHETYLLRAIPIRDGVKSITATGLIFGKEIAPRDETLNPNPLPKQ